MGRDYSSDESEAPEELGRGVCVEERQLSIKVVLGGVHSFIPKSVIHDDSEVFKLNDSGKLIVKHWWAAKEGWV